MKFVKITHQVAPFDLKYENYFQEQKQLDPIVPEQATHPICPVDVFDLDLGIPNDSIKQPIKCNSVSSGDVSH